MNSAWKHGTNWMAIYRFRLHATVYSHLHRGNLHSHHFRSVWPECFRHYCHTDMPSVQRIGHLDLLHRGWMYFSLFSTLYPMSLPPRADFRFSLHDATDSFGHGNVIQPVAVRLEWLMSIVLLVHPMIFGNVQSANRVHVSVIDRRLKKMHHLHGVVFDSGILHPTAKSKWTNNQRYKRYIPVKHG